MSEQHGNTRKRRDWPIVKSTLTAEFRTRPLALPPRDALAMMWRLAQDAWASAGRPMPEYPRSKSPMRKLAPNLTPADID